LELVLHSSDSQGTFYCNSRVDIQKQRNKLVATIDNTVAVSPIFQLHTEQTNSTTIRIRIVPNGHIGINRISCHWDNNATYGQAADLIIGGIQMNSLILKRDFQIIPNSIAKVFPKWKYLGSLIIYALLIEIYIQ
jgi:hypothetical protein